MDKPPETLPRPFVRWYINGEFLGDTEYDAENDQAVTPQASGRLERHGPE